tara:strand:- start:15 stop:263 length:249 start_codon:yes stop_codon:yes gene_type:complete
MPLTRKKIIIKNKGELIKHGYKGVKKLSRKQRRIALDKAVDEYGKLKVMRKLGAIRALHYNKDRPLSDKYYSDLKYVQGKSK